MRRRLVVLVVPLLLLFAIAVFAFLRAGVWLTVADPLQHARAVVVLGGAMPYRAIEAAAIYKAGWAGEVWVTYGTSWYSASLDAGSTWSSGSAASSEQQWIDHSTASLIRISRIVEVRDIW